MEEKISAFDKITGIFQKRPIASMAVVLFISLYLCYKIVKSTFADRIKQSEKDIAKAENNTKICEDENRDLVYNLLIKNNIINANKAADSVIKKKTPEAVEIIKDQKQ